MEKKVQGKSDSKEPDIKVHILNVGQPNFVSNMSMIG